MRWAYFFVILGAAVLTVALTVNGVANTSHRGAALASSPRQPINLKVALGLYLVMIIILVGGVGALCVLAAR